MAHRNDVVMPITVRFGSSSEPRLNTDLLFAGSGYRKANQKHAEPLHTLSLQYRLAIADVYNIQKIWKALGGPFDSFLARDWSDWNTSSNMVAGSVSWTFTDAPLMNPNLSPINNVGDGTTTVFQTYKNYAEGSASRNYRIRHPVAADFSVGVNGSDETSALSPSVNEETGEVTLSPGSPDLDSGDTLTWGGTFYRAVAFTEDAIRQLLRNRKVDTLSAVLQEVKGA